LKRIYVGLNISVHHFSGILSDLNNYLLYFPEAHPKKLDQDEIIEILDQANTGFPEWHEVIANANIDILEISCEESVSYLKRLKNLEKIRLTIDLVNFLIINALC
jgi:hypothetical protein